MAEPVTINGSLMLRLPEAQKVLGNMARSTLYREMEKGKLKAVRRGRSVYITAAEICRYAADLSGEDNDG